MGRLAIYKLMYFLSILGTIAIAIFSIVAHYASHADPNIYPRMPFFGVVLSALLAVNIFLIIYWTIRWRYWVWIPVIAIACNISYVSAIFQFKIFEKEIVKAEKSIKIITCNIHNFNDEITGYTAKEVEKYMQKENIDIICFQEFIPNVDFTLDSISKVFHRYPYKTVESQLAIYSKYPIKQSAFVPFKDSNNCGQWADIQVNDKTVRLFNVHMQTTFLYYMKRFSAVKVLETLSNNFKMRANQANEIHSLIDATETPVILCGDFNDPPSSYTYWKLKGDLADGFKTCGNGYEYTFRNMHGFLRIDYILHSPSLKGINYYSHPIDWSDHNPVVMELGL